MFSRLNSNEVYYLELCVTDAVGDPVSNLLITYTIVRLPDTEVENGSLVEVQNVYQKAVSFGEEGQYRIYYHLPENFPDVIEHVMVKNTFEPEIEQHIISIASDLKRALGLLHENIFIDLPVYDENNNLVSARVRIYSDSNSVGTDFGIIGTYQITCESTEAGKFTTWKQVSY